MRVGSLDGLLSLSLSLSCLAQLYMSFYFLFSLREKVSSDTQHRWVWSKIHMDRYMDIGWRGSWTVAFTFSYSGVLYTVYFHDGNEVTELQRQCSSGHLTIEIQNCLEYITKNVYIINEAPRLRLSAQRSFDFRGLPVLLLTLPASQ